MRDRKFYIFVGQSIGGAGHSSQWRGTRAHLDALDKIKNDKKELSEFGKNTPMRRAGQPCEVGPAFVYLACEDASYITGQFIHINGGGFIG